MVSRWAAALALGLFWTACKGGDGAGRAASVDGGQIFSVTRGTRIFELRQPVSVDGAPVASNNYFCSSCATDPVAASAFDAAILPRGWDVAPLRITEAGSVTLFDPVNSRGAPRRLDLIDAIAGDELRLGAQPLFGQIVAAVPAVIVTMESSRRLSWDAGDTVQEIEGDGQTYVLFARVKDPGAAPPESITLPAGWTHGARTLDSPFVLAERPRVVVFMHLTHQHLWQRVVPPA